MIKVPCNLCANDDWHVRYPATTNNSQILNVDVFRCTSLDYGRHAQIVQCNHCDLVYANPRWSQEELEAAYQAVEDETYVVERDGRELTFKKHLAKLQSLTGPPRRRSLLDVGAYIGVFVEVAQNAGWNAYGIEPSSWAVSQAQQRNLHVFQGTQHAQLLSGMQFDVITMWDVIEHLADPATEIHQSYKLLKPGGWLAIHTMNIDSLTSRLMKNRWPWLMDMHLYYFSKKTLAEMLRKSGFEIIWSGSQGRYLRLGYLASRLQGFYEPVGQFLSNLVDRVHINETPIPVNFGDLFTVFARKPQNQG